MGLEIEIARKDKPNIRTVAFPNAYSDSKNLHPLPPPELGEHNVEYLKPLGYSDQQIAEFKEKGII
jgi:crotonobetainyl-CoA:carnitine CoA-transferase CaiB-like acyl-CoA transferase